MVFRLVQTKKPAPAAGACKSCRIRLRRPAPSQGPDAKQASQAPLVGQNPPGRPPPPLAAPAPARGPELAAGEVDQRRPRTGRASLRPTQGRATGQAGNPANPSAAELAPEARALFPRSSSPNSTQPASASQTRNLRRLSLPGQSAAVAVEATPVELPGPRTPARPDWNRASHPALLFPGQGRSATTGNA